MEDSITLRLSEQRRVHVLIQLAGGVISSGQAAELLSLSERQVRRLAAALGSDGPAGLIHGNRGRRPSNAVNEATAARVIELATTTYRRTASLQVLQLCAATYEPREPVSPYPGNGRWRQRSRREDRGGRRSPRLLESLRGLATDCEDDREPRRLGQGGDRPELRRDVRL